MNKRLFELSPDFPHLFLNGDPYQFPVRRGWHFLCARAFRRLTALFLHHEIPFSAIIVNGIEEKNGSLRLHVGCSQHFCPAEFLSSFESILETVESESKKVCRECSRPGTWLLVGKEWMTVCVEHEVEETQKLYPHFTFEQVIDEVSTKYGTMVSECFLAMEGLLQQEIQTKKPLAPGEQHLYLFYKNMKDEANAKLEQLENLEGRMPF